VDLARKENRCDSEDVYVASPTDFYKYQISNGGAIYSRSVEVTKFEKIKQDEKQRTYGDHTPILT
jgi:hypothetical protein